MNEQPKENTENKDNKEVRGEAADMRDTKTPENNPQNKAEMPNPYNDEEGRLKMQSYNDDQNSDPILAKKQ